MTRHILTPHDFQIGETVYYFLPRAPKNGRPTDQYLEGVVVSSNKMVRIKPTQDRYERNVAATSLVRNPPEGAVLR